MTFPPDDDRLVEFLRRHRPEPPPAAPELESQLMATVAQSQRQWVRPQRRRWTARALAAALVLAGGAGVVWRLTAPRLQTAAGVDEFVADTWYASAYGDEARLPLDTTQSDWLVSVYATPY